MTGSERISELGHNSECKSWCFCIRNLTDVQSLASVNFNQILNIPLEAREKELKQMKVQITGFLAKSTKLVGIENRFRRFGTK